MKTMTWMLRREFWEHKGAFFWAPMVVGGALLLLIGGMIIYGIAGAHFSDITVINGQEVSRINVIDALSATKRAELADIAANNYLAAAAPLFLVLPLVVFFYCLAALYDDRRDRSILFWKSLPMSDQATVLSKVVTALVVAPVITIVIGTVTALSLLLLGLTALSINGVSMFGALLSTPAVYLAPFSLLALLPVYFLWALPTVGWLLLVSSWARSKVFLWAVGVPMIVLVMLKWMNYLLSQYSDTIIDISWFTNNIIIRGLGGLFPGVWLPFTVESPAALQDGAQQGVNVSNLLTQSWMSLAQPGVWVAAAVGVAMLYGAVRMRRWRDEG